MRTDEIITKCVGDWRIKTGINIIPKRPDVSVEQILREVCGRVIAAAARPTEQNFSSIALEEIEKWQSGAFGIKMLVRKTPTMVRPKYAISDGIVKDHQIFIVSIRSLIRSVLKSIGENISLNALPKSEQKQARKDKAEAEAV